MWHYGFFWGFPFFPLFGLIFWILVVSLIWGRGHRFAKYHDHMVHGNKSAGEILAERFANGEIDEKEYDHRLAVLRKNGEK
jgi:putative membrane protein